MDDETRASLDATERNSWAENSEQDNVGTGAAHYQTTVRTAAGTKG